MSQVVKFILILFAFLVFAFTMHLTYLNFKNLPLYDHKISLAYIINFLVAVFIYLGLFLLKDKWTEQLGFVYMGGSFIKFILFFIFFYPSYKLDGDINSLEFGAFFIPYTISLIMETLGVINFLKK